MGSCCSISHKPLQEENPIKESHSSTTPKKKVYNQEGNIFFI